LVAPLSILVMLMTALAIHERFPVLGNFTFVDAVSKMVVAWIVIRIAVQIVHDKFARNLISGIIWIMAALSIFGVLDDTASLLDSLGLSMGSFRLSVLTVVKALLSTMLLLYIANGMTR